jgi:hypothetical protein
LYYAETKIVFFTQKNGMFKWQITIDCHGLILVRTIAYLSLLPSSWVSVTRFFASVFFHESVSPQPQSIPLTPFQILLKIRGDICKSRCTTGINDTGGKFATGVNDAGNKLTAGINDTGGKFFHQFR